jgi:type IV pilus assembly protein PilA
MKLNSLKQSKGFTLVEILIVVIIVGLLAGIAVSKLGDSKERAVAAVKKSAAAELNKAIQATYVKGDIIPAAVVAALPATTAGVLDLISPTGSAGTVISSQFTASSLTELASNIQNETPNSGSVALNGGATHSALEVVYSSTDYVAP